MDMKQGKWDEFVVKNQKVDSFLEKYEKVLEDNEFVFKEKKQDGTILRHKSIWGHGKGSFKRSLIPGGALTEKGNRYGAEAEISQRGEDVYFRLLVVPYMSLFDRHDIFMISQGPMEKFVDDEQCKDKLFKIVMGLREKKLDLEAQT
jgi:hypothetical protein